MEITIQNDDEWNALSEVEKSDTVHTYLTNAIPEASKKNIDFIKSFILSDEKNSNRDISHYANHIVKCALGLSVETNIDKICCRANAVTRDVSGLEKFNAIHDEISNLKKK